LSRKGDQLYGRYWGSFQDIECLHFDACYYAPIEWATLKHPNFDPGAGGRHKNGFPAASLITVCTAYNPRLTNAASLHPGK